MFLLKLVGTITKKEGEKEKRGVWKCRDTGEVYEAVEYVCDLETWAKAIEEDDEMEMIEIE